MLDCFQIIFFSMNFKERKKLLKYYLDLSCAFSGMEKVILFVRFDELPFEGQLEVIEELRLEVTELAQIFS